MDVLKRFNGKFNLLGRISLTLAVGVLAIVSLYLVSGTVKAVEDINLTDDTLAELSQFVAEGHASIRRIMATPGSSPTRHWWASRKPSSAASRGCAR